MAKLYKRNCDQCHGYYEKKNAAQFCSRKCMFLNEVYREKMGSHNRGKHPIMEIKKGERRSVKTEFKKGLVPWNKGLSMPFEYREKLSKAHGALVYQPDARHSDEYRRWRSDVFKRDDYTCQSCGTKGVPIQAHHIKSFSKFPELRFVADNGLTLCVPCHKKTDTYLKNGN
jgi:hypothetical protein